MISLEQSSETQSSETFVSYECRLVMYVVDLFSTHVYIWIWFVVISLGEGVGAIKIKPITFENELRAFDMIPCGCSNQSK